MTGHTARCTGVRRLEPLVASVREWARFAQIALGARDELAVTSPNEARRIARELAPARRPKRDLVGAEAAPPPARH